MSKLQVYTFGHSGVVIDMNPVEPSLPMDSLLNAQNANHHSIAAYGGAVRKRPGFKQFNVVAAGGAVLGGIPMSVAGTGGAPVPGNKIGPTGDPTGGPPGGVPGPGTPVPVSGTVNPTSTLFGSPFNGRRLLVIGRDDSTGGNLKYGNSWYVSDTQMADVAQIQITGIDTIAGPPAGTKLGGAGIETVTSAVTTIANGSLYYPTGSSDPAIVPATLPTVRKLSADGKTDVLAFTIPDNPLVLAIVPVPAHEVGINALLTEFGNGNALYCAVADIVADGAQAGSYGRVFRVTGLDSGNYVITEIYNSLNTNASAALNGTAAQPTVPYTLGNFLGGVWFGTWRGAAGLANGPTFAELQIDTSQPDGYKQSNVLINANASAADVGCMTSIGFLGSMYIGYIHRGGGVTFATIYSYTGSPAAVALSLTGGNGGALGAAADPNGFLSMVVFNGKLYASYFNTGTVAYIYSFDGTAWSIVYTGSAAGTAQPLSLQVDNGVLYAFGDKTNQLFLWSLDGITFTDATAKFPNVNGGFSIPVLFGIVQQ
jgi:hypothetical protein